MYYGWPDERALHAALVLATRAPSVHNSQPWRFRIGARRIDLYLDPLRAQPPTGSIPRDALSSCGAALHHLRVALAAAGWSTVVRRLPNPEDPNHLASLAVVRHRPTMLELALGNAIPRRQTDRRDFGPAPIPPGSVGLVQERAMANGANVRQAVGPTRAELVEVLDAAAQCHRGGARCHRYGEPAVFGSASDHAELLVLSTGGDERLAQLRAGEALSAVLLTATNVGLASCALTDPLRAPDLRQRVRTRVLSGRGYPQAVIRIGWAPTDATTPPATPRRQMSDVLETFEAAS
ncbi:NAD(P)H nitroreductase [Nocardia brasiliensis]|uniref:NAD(P)H nitroreductase n=2 Tax=Nocardia brasiliensis TaxID=37326 RepID=A0A6G9XRY6_NOCBR|nr:NAD(P)H nitroreductase [Nocardia brasiliensis]